MADEARVREADPLAVDGRTYDSCYYERYAGGSYERSPQWMTFFGGIADRIVTEIGPSRVLDAGCAIGLLVECLRTRSINAFGIDFSEFAIANVYDPIKPFCSKASVTDLLREQYDLIICLEVLEHLTPGDGERAISNFCSHTRDILFSSSPIHYSEATHLNTQPAEYWAAHFARHGFYRDTEFDASFVAPWAIRFRYRTDPPHRIVADYERGFARVEMERNELRALALATQGEIARITQERENLKAEMERGRASAAAETRGPATRDELLQEIASAHSTIALMQRSWFWRIRRPWDWLSRQLGRTPKS